MAREFANALSPLVPIICQRLRSYPLSSSPAVRAINGACLWVLGLSLLRNKKSVDGGPASGAAEIGVHSCSWCFVCFLAVKFGSAPVLRPDRVCRGECSRNMSSRGNLSLSLLIHSCWHWEVRGAFFRDYKDCRLDGQLSGASRCSKRWSCRDIRPATTSSAAGFHMCNHNAKWSFYGSHVKVMNELPSLLEL